MTCRQYVACGHLCGRPHHATMTWPGADPQPVCLRHLQTGQGIAEHMGFRLVFQLTPEGEKLQASIRALVALGEGDESVEAFLDALDAETRG